MSKAVQGIAELGAAAALIGGAMLLPGGGWALAMTPLFQEAVIGLALGGLATTAGAIAGALTANRGTNITTRQPAAQRQVIYGQQRVGDIMIYESGTGSTHRQYNRVIVLAGHQIAGIEALYLDGRKVWFDSSSGGSRTYNGLTFGGSANGNTYTGPSGQRYNFGGLVYCEMRDGSQASGDVITGLTANDPAWAATSAGSPYVGGCAYVYLKVEYDQATFPSDPEIKFLVHGKACWDPRTSSYVPGCTNPALIAADILTDPIYGLGDDWDSVYTGAAETQLIAAANVCDEYVALAAGGAEARYACGLHYDSSTGAGDVLVQVMDAMAGRISRIGGQWFIYPAYWQGAAFSFDQKSLTAEPTWNPNRAFKDLNNRVRGTFTSPNFPYNIGGNAYDANGFDSSGNAQDNFSFAWQTTSFPEYATDPRHGYAADQYLNEDSGVTAAYDPAVTYAAGTVVSYTQTVAGVGYATVWASVADGNVGNTPGPSSPYWKLASVPLVENIALPAVLSLAQAQRIAKIRLLRNRMQGMGQMEMRVSALGMVPLSVMQFTWPKMGWTDKVLEISSCSPFRIVRGSGDQPPSVRATFGVQETDPSIYEWDAATEELGIYGVPTIAPQQSYVVAPPTSMVVTSGAATALTALDGTVTPRAEVTWATPQDGLTTQIQSQYKLSSASAWIDGPAADAALNALFINVVAGQVYDFRIRSFRPGGAVSVWVEIAAVTASLTINSQTALGEDPAALIPSSYTDGTSSIQCIPFTALVGQLALSLFPSGPVTITNDSTLGGAGSALTQQVTYWVYYYDPTVAGGNVTPLATTNPADYLGKNGYFLIGVCTTPFAGSGGGTAPTRYAPTTGSDSSTCATINPTYAYDGSLTSYASVSGLCTTTGGTGGIILRNRSSSGDYAWTGFASNVSTSARTLSIVFSVAIGNSGSATGGEVDLNVYVGTTLTALGPFTATTSKATYSFTVAAGVDLSTLSVEVVATPGSGTVNGDSSSVQGRVYEIYVQ